MEIGNNRKIYFSLVLLGLILVAGFITKRKFYDPRHQLENARVEVKELLKNDEIKNGDLIFQSSLSGQSRAVQLATRSKYSHCGIIYKEGNEYYVFEAVQPAKKTPLDKWITHGDDGHYVIKRLKNADEVLTPEALLKMKQVAETFEGKDYDLTFEWSDEKIYCSELIWKIYQRATGVEIGKLEKLKDFNLDNDVVRQKLQERYGNNIPMEETVVSPGSIFNSELLVMVKSNE